MRGLLVAACASELRMRAGQRKMRFLRVIEFPNVPAVRVVAVGALFAESAFMDVVALMATIAFLAHAFVARARVTLRARHGNVKTDEWKTAQVVIERDIDSPPFRLVALFAILAELARMNVLRAMAAVACRAELLLADESRMTGMAIYFDVFAGERKFCIAVVIELLRLPSMRIVAFAAILSHARGVIIVGGMAAVAVLRNLVLHPAGLMTRSAI